MRRDLRHVLMNRIKQDKHSNNDFADTARFNNNARSYDAAYMDGYDSGYEDGRRGVRGSGMRNDRNSFDENDYDDDEFEKRLMLPKRVKEQWLHKLKDAQGNVGPRFTKDDVMRTADKMQVEYDEYTPSDLYLMTNVLYSDCTVFRQLTPKEKEPYYWVAAAKEWLEDPDASVRGSEKVVSHYYNIVNG